MEVTLSSQISALLCAFLFGVGVGALYDLYRVLLVLFSLLPSDKSRGLPQKLPLLPPKWLIKRTGKAGARARGILLFLSDTLFAVTSGILFTLFLYAENDGIFRLYLFLGVALTFILYLLTVGRIVFRAAGFLSVYLHIFLLYVAFLLTLPFRLLLFVGAFLWRKILSPVLVRLSAPIFRHLRYTSARRRYTRALRAAFDSFKDMRSL